MEARASINGAGVSKTFVAAVLVLVAMGLGAMGGYAVKGLGVSGAPAAGATQVQVYPAPGTHLREDVEPQSRSDNSSIRPTSGGTRGNHGEI